jgi:hypothetical protein
VKQHSQTMAAAAARQQHEARDGANPEKSLRKGKRSTKTRKMHGAQVDTALPLFLPRNSTLTSHPYTLALTGLSRLFESYGVACHDGAPRAGRCAAPPTAVPPPLPTAHSIRPIGILSVFRRAATRPVAVAAARRWADRLLLAGQHGLGISAGVETVPRALQLLLEHDSTLTVDFEDYTNAFNELERGAIVDILKTGHIRCCCMVQSHSGMGRPVIRTERRTHVCIPSARWSQACRNKSKVKQCWRHRQITASIHGPYHLLIVEVGVQMRHVVKQ